MKTLDIPKIASWEEADDYYLDHQESIATESQPPQEYEPPIQTSYRESIATTYPSQVATWIPDDYSSNHQESIATESQQDANPIWEECINALLKTWQSQSRIAEDEFIAPNRSAIESAIEWLVFLRKHYPSAPPTMITPEPAGGIIVEGRMALSNGTDGIWELTFYNDGLAESTFYRNGKVVFMEQMPARPPLRDIRS